MLTVPEINKKIEPYIEMNQKGFVEISNDLIENNSEAVLNVFKNIIPLEIYHFKQGITTYMCLCKNFRDLKENESIPYYDCIYDSIEKSCTFTERK